MVVEKITEVGGLRIKTCANVVIYNYYLSSIVYYLLCIVYLLFTIYFP